jgi:hypothetical protein
MNIFITFNPNGARRKLMLKVKHWVGFFGNRAIARCSNDAPAAKD